VAVQVMERWILARLRDQRFQTLEEVDGAIGDLLDSLNTRAFRRLPGSRQSAFELLDRSALRPLPASPYEFARYYRARVNIDYHVSFDEHFYSVPHALVHQDVEARVTATAVEVLHRGQRVAAHRRSSHRFAHTTVSKHMPAAHRAHLEWSPARLIRWGAQHGPACAQVIERILTTRKHPEQGYRACFGLLKLEKHYGAQRLEAACVCALALGSPAYQTVASILKRRVEALPLADESSWSSPEHAHLRGPKYYQ
jgi:transposase